MKKLIITEYIDPIFALVDLVQNWGISFSDEP
jgi:hypothetical protein